MFGTKLSKSSSAVVTGAGSGIGRAFALELAARGGRVICSDIQLAAAEETVALIEAAAARPWRWPATSRSSRRWRRSPPNPNNGSAIPWTWW
jgi:NAD(P)-dependent dehydrogenase (short-subunit alcohol dehydrogenase family)